MMRMMTRKNVAPPTPPPPPPPPPRRDHSASADNDWERRPGGMLVQKRTETDQNFHSPSPTIRVHVKYGSISHHIYISSEATFGELKKMLTGPTGLHHQDQKLYYKNKERDSKAFLDSAGVKNKSKIVLEEDTVAKQKRLLEMKRNAKTEKDKKLMSEVIFQVDKLARKVSAIESVILKGGKVAENDVLHLIDLLMTELLKLEGVIGDDDVKLQRKILEKRLQKYVETLDMLKMKNTISTSNVNNNPMHQQQKVGRNASPAVQQPQAKRHQEAINSLKQPSSHLSSGPVVITTQWETFDSTPPLIPVAPSTSTPAQPSFIWNLL